MGNGLVAGLSTTRPPEAGPPSGSSRTAGPPLPRPPKAFTKASGFCSTPLQVVEWTTTSAKVRPHVVSRFSDHSETRPSPLALPVDDGTVGPGQITGILAGHRQLVVGLPAEADQDVAAGRVQLGDPPVQFQVCPRGVQ